MALPRLLLASLALLLLLLGLAAVAVTAQHPCSHRLLPEKYVVLRWKSDKLGGQVPAEYERDADGRKRWNFARDQDGKLIPITECEECAAVVPSLVGPGWKNHHNLRWMNTLSDAVTSKVGSHGSWGKSFAGFIAKGVNKVAHKTVDSPFTCAFKFFDNHEGRCMPMDDVDDSVPPDRLLALSEYLQHDPSNAHTRTPPTPRSTWFWLDDNRATNRDACLVQAAVFKKKTEAASQQLRKQQLNAGLREHAYVFGDIHADPYNLVRSLLVAGLLNTDGSMKKLDESNEIMVQLGDINDRGPFSRLVSDYFLAMDENDVIRVMGNHETLLAMGTFSHLNNLEVIKMVAGSSFVEFVESWTNCHGGRFSLLLQLGAVIRLRDRVMSHGNMAEAYVNFLAKQRLMREANLEAAQSAARLTGLPEDLKAQLEAIQEEMALLDRPVGDAATAIVKQRIVELDEQSKWVHLREAAWRVLDAETPMLLEGENRMTSQQRAAWRDLDYANYRVRNQLLRYCSYFQLRSSPLRQRRDALVEAAERTETVDAALTFMAKYYRLEQAGSLNDLKIVKGLEDEASDLLLHHFRNQARGNLLNIRDAILDDKQAGTLDAELAPHVMDLWSYEDMSLLDDEFKQPVSPLWARNLANIQTRDDPSDELSVSYANPSFTANQEAKACASVSRMMKALAMPDHTGGFVAGHTKTDRLVADPFVPQLPIVSRCGGKYIFTDTAISRFEKQDILAPGPTFGQRDGDNAANMGNPSVLYLPLVSARPRAVSRESTAEDFEESLREYKRAHEEQRFSDDEDDGEEDLEAEREQSAVRLHLDDSEESHSRSAYSQREIVEQLQEESHSRSAYSTRESVEGPRLALPQPKMPTQDDLDDDSVPTLDLQDWLDDDSHDVVTPGRKASKDFGRDPQMQALLDARPASAGYCWAPLSSGGTELYNLVPIENYDPGAYRKNPTGSLKEKEEFARVRNEFNHSVCNMNSVLNLMKKVFENGRRHDNGKDLIPARLLRREPGTVFDRQRLVS